MKPFLLPLCMIFSLLAGCTAPPTATQATSPEPSDVSTPPSASASASALPREARWWERLDLDNLPHQAADLTGDPPRDALFLMKDLPDDDVSLYGYLSGDDTPSGILLRRGSTFTHFDQDFLSEQNPVAPQFWWMDADGDGTPELAAYYVLENTDTVFRSEFHIYEVSEEGWNDHPLRPDSCRQALRDALSAHWEDECLVLEVGSSILTLSTDGLTVPVDRNAALSCADRIFYRYDRGIFTGVYTVGVTAADGTSHALANLLADIAYDGSNITLTNLRLEGYYGV